MYEISSLTIFSVSIFFGTDLQMSILSSLPSGQSYLKAYEMISNICGCYCCDYSLFELQINIIGVYNLPYLHHRPRFSPHKMVSPCTWTPHVYMWYCGNPTPIWKIKSTSFKKMIFNDLSPQLISSPPSKQSERDKVR